MGSGGDHEDLGQVLDNTELETTFSWQLEQAILKLQKMDGDCHLTELEDICLTRMWTMHSPSKSLPRRRWINMS